MSSCLINDEGRECTVCREHKSWDNYCKGSGARGRTPVCLDCRNARQRILRNSTNNASTKKYEKTKKGFLMRLYRNMESRVTGVQKSKHYLYAGLKLLPRKEFYKWAESSEEFHRLFAEYEASDYDIKLAPSVSRVDSFYGYELWNMEWVTMSENSRRGALSKYGGQV